MKALLLNFSTGGVELNRKAADESILEAEKVIATGKTTKYESLFCKILRDVEESKRAKAINKYSLNSTYLLNFCSITIKMDPIQM